MNTDELLQRAKDIHAAAGTDVRCPVCNAAEGFFCRVPNTNTRADAPHAERLALAQKGAR
jgi:hypothetical protein